MNHPAINPDVSTCIAIDGANLYQTAKLLNVMIDYRRLRDWLYDVSNALAINYFTAIPDRKDGEEHPIIKSLDFIEYNGFNLITKPLKEIKTADDRTFIKGNIDVELVIYTIEAAANFQQFILFSGDSDYTALMTYLNRRGIKTVVISSIKTSPVIIADSLRRSAQNFIDIDSLLPLIAMPPKEPAPVVPASSAIHENELTEHTTHDNALK